MHRKCVHLLFLFFLTSCNDLEDDFFEFIFGIQDISLNRICADNPSVFSEGRFIEIYSVSESDINKIVKSINNYSLDKKKHSKYKIYKTPVWKSTPVHKPDSILNFSYNQLSEEKNACFDEATIDTVLLAAGNYYLPLYDNLGRLRLFILDTKNAKLFLLTSYIL